VLADLLILLASFAVLAVAADRFVLSSSAVATLLGASPLFIGVVLIGVGTSLPDWLVSAFAAARGEDGLASGNFIGSNTVNVGLALGIAALITPLAVTTAVLRREALVSIVSVIAVSLLLIGGIGRVEGIALLVALPVALLVLRPAHPPPPDRERVGGSLAGRLAIALVALAATVAASRLLVGSAGDVALELGVSEAFIGLSLVAIGTSLPEIVVGIQAARRHETDLIVGNVLGSNLINSLGLAGTAALVVPEAPLEAPGLGGAAVLMVAFAVVSGLLLASGRRLVRWEGALLVAVYLLTLPLFASG
jgi:cation:H+ antiporter